jgi:hypothetical protein
VGSVLVSRVAVEVILQIIEPYNEDGGEEPRLCQHAVFSSGAKCNAEIVLRDEPTPHKNWVAIWIYSQERS